MHQTHVPNLVCMVGLCLGLLFATCARAAPRTPEELARDYNQNSFVAVGRDAFPVLHDPEMSSAAEANEVMQPNQWVIGIEINGEAKAYPVAVMGLHELVNDHVGGEPVAICW